MGARTTFEEFCMEAMDVMGTVMGSLTLSVERLLCRYLSYRQIPNWKYEENRLGRLDQVFGEPSNHKVQ